MIQSTAFGAALTTLLVVAWLAVTSMSDGPDPRSFDQREPGLSDRREADDLDPLDALTSCLDLPSGRERERVYVHDQEYELRGSEARARATIGAFWLVQASDLRD